VHDELATLDATAQADMVRRGEVRPIDLVDAAIERIQRIDPKLNAVTIRLFDQARAYAESASVGDGPFRGVPLLLKDYFCHSAGDSYYAGTRFLKELDWHEDRDTYLAARFRSAGFIFIGKTNLPELANGVTTDDDCTFGRTNNPWNLGCSPGGSSSGSCAAVAAGLVPLAHANDGTGSIRIPASACGLVGLKPSRGRVSPGPARLPFLLGNLSEHVVTRTVRDTAAVLDAIRGSMPGDIYTAPSPVRPFIEEIGAEPGVLRVGLLIEDVFLNNPVHTDCIAAVHKTASMLEQMGHIVEESYPAALTGATGLGPPLRVIATSRMAAQLDYWSDRIGRPITQHDVSRRNWEGAEMGRSYSAVDLQHAVARLASGVMRAPEWWSSGFDILLTPTMQQPPPTWDMVRTGNEAAIWGLFTMPFSITGQPAISLPLHRTRDGLPVGVQLVADYGREGLLLRLAARLEEALPWRHHVPPVFAQQPESLWGDFAN
jgi:amidase